MEGRLDRLIGRLRGDKSSDSQQSIGEIDTEEKLIREGAVEQLTREGRAILIHSGTTEAW